MLKNYFLLLLIALLYSCAQNIEETTVDAAHPYKSVFEKISKEELKETSNLEINSLEFDSLPSDIIELKNLEALTISGLHSSATWNILAKLTDLKYLTIKNDTNTNLPIDLTKFTKLSHLCIADSKYEKLVLSRNSSIQNINITNTQGLLKNTIALLENLNTIEIQKSDLTEVPEVHKKAELILLNLNKNKISKCDEKLDLRFKKGNSALNLAHNPIDVKCINFLLKNNLFTTLGLDACNLNAVPEII